MRLQYVEHAFDIEADDRHAHTGSPERRRQGGYGKVRALRIGGGGKEAGDLGARKG
jgi:hypothetical protein